jgi:hypothetical protein
MERNNIVFRDEWGNDLTSDGSGQISPYCTGGYANQLNDELKLSFKQIARRLKSRDKYYLNNNLFLTINLPNTIRWPTRVLISFHLKPYYTAFS